MLFQFISHPFSINFERNLEGKRRLTLSHDAYHLITQKTINLVSSALFEFYIVYQLPVIIDITCFSHFNLNTFAKLVVFWILARWRGRDFLSIFFNRESALLMIYATSGRLTWAVKTGNLIKWFNFLKESAFSARNVCARIYFKGLKMVS